MPIAPTGLYWASTALVFCPWHGRVWKGCAPLEYGREPGHWQMGWTFYEQLCHRKADQGSSWFVSEWSGWCVLSVLCLSVGSVLVTVLWLTGGPSSCLQFLSDVWLEKKTLKLSFLTWPWWEQDRNNTSVVFLYFYSDYFTLAWQDGAGASRWGLSAREVAPVK